MNKVEMRAEIDKLRGDLAYERQKVAGLESGAKEQEQAPKGWVPLGRLDALALSFKLFLSAVDKKSFSDDDIQKAKKALEPYSWDYFRHKGLHP